MLNHDAKPFAIHTPRKVPIPLMEKVKSELDRMLRLGVISKVDEPTQWCAGMVVVPKPNGKVRICVDFTKLNQSVKRENHPLPSVDESLAKLAGATVFTKLDANSGFWQINLAEESKSLTTFMAGTFLIGFHLEFAQLANFSKKGCQKCSKITQVCYVIWMTFWFSPPTRRASSESLRDHRKVRYHT